MLRTISRWRSACSATGSYECKCVLVYLGHERGKHRWVSCLVSSWYSCEKKRGGDGGPVLRIIEVDNSTSHQRNDLNDLCAKGEEAR